MRRGGGGGGHSNIFFSNQRKIKSSKKRRRNSEWKTTIHFIQPQNLSIFNQKKRKSNLLLFFSFVDLFCTIIYIFKSKSYLWAPTTTAENKF